MSVSLYDEAVFAKIRKWIPNTATTILKPNETSRLFGIKADLENDGIPSMPLVAISRDPSINVNTTGRCPMSFSGYPVKSDSKVTVELEAIPITVTYQLDIYTQKAVEGDSILREIIYNMVNHPKMIIEIPYNGLNLNHTCVMLMEADVTDNSDIPERIFPDQFTRWTIRFSIGDAYFWSVPVKENYRIGEVQLEIKDRPQPGDDVVTTEWSAEDIEAQNYISEDEANSESDENNEN